jgi:ABC-2 type transport system permease protein
MSARVVRSEWTKLHSLRSTRITMLVAIALVIGLGLLVSLASVDSWSAFDEAHRSTYDSVERSLGGIYFAQLAFGMLGVIVVTGEYTTGMIRATIAAVPRRLPVLWGKLTVFAAVTLALGTIACALAFIGGQAIFASKDVDAGFGDPGVLRAVLGAGLFCAGIGALGVGLGALLRNTAAGVATMTCLLFVVPLIVSLLPERWQGIGPYLPGNAGAAIIFMGSSPDRLAPWAGMGVLWAWAAIAVALAAVMLMRRDV